MQQLRPALPEDNDALIRLTQACPMAGEIVLRIDREPDFFSLCGLRGPGQVYVVEIPSGIVGCISLSVQSLWWQGIEVKALYVADFKVHPDCRRGRAAFLLMKAALEFAQEQHVDLAYLLTPEGNDPLLRLLSGRAVFPPFSPWQTFSVYEFRLARKRVRSAPAPVQPAEAWALWAPYQKAFQLGMHQSLAEFEQAVKESGTELIGLRSGGKLVAVAGLCDTGPFKQNVVLRMPTTLRLGVAAQRLLAGLTGSAPLPAQGEAIRMMSLKYWACAEGASAALVDLFDVCLQKAYQGGFSFLSLGLDPADPLDALLRRRPKFTFKSCLMGTALPFGKVALPESQPGAPFTVDFSLV